MVILATVGTHNNGLPAIAVRLRRGSPSFEFPSDLGSPPHRLPDIGDDRCQDGRIVQAVLAAEPPRRLVDAWRLSTLPFQGPQSSTRSLIDSSWASRRNRFDEAVPVGERRCQAGARGLRLPLSSTGASRRRLRLGRFQMRAAAIGDVDDATALQSGEDRTKVRVRSTRWSWANSSASGAPPIPSLRSLRAFFAPMAFPTGLSAIRLILDTRFPGSAA